MSWKKIAVWVGLFMAVFTVPLIIISNPMLRHFQEKYEADPESEWNNSLLWFSAGMAYKTNRFEIGVTGYEKWIENNDPDHEDFPFALLRYALCLEGSKRYDDAIENYDYFMALFPAHDDFGKAKKGIDRIKYVIPNTNLKPENQ